MLPSNRATSSTSSQSSLPLNPNQGVGAEQPKTDHSFSFKGSLNNAHQFCTQDLMDSLAICFREDDSWTLSEPGQEMLADEKELYRDSGDKGLTEKQKLRQQKRERLRREQLKEVQLSITGQKGSATSLAEKDGNLLDMLRERLAEPDAQELIHDWAENDLHLLPGGDCKLTAKVMALLVGADPRDKQVLDKIAGMDLRETRSELDNMLHVALRDAKAIHTGSRDGQWLRGQLAQLASHWSDATKWAVDAVVTTSIMQLVTSSGPVINIPALRLIGQSGAVPVASLIFNTLYLAQTACNIKKHGISKAIDIDLSQRLEGALKMLLTRSVHSALGSVGQKVCDLANYMVGVVTQQGIPAVGQAVPQQPVPQQPQALNQTQEAGCPTPARPTSSMMVLNLSGQTLNGQGVDGQPVVLKYQSFETLRPVQTVCPATSDDTPVAEGEGVACEAFESIDMTQHMVTDQNGQTLIRTRGEVDGFAGVFGHENNEGGGYIQTQLAAGTPGPGIQKPTPLHRAPTKNSVPDEAAAEAESKIIDAKPMVQAVLQRVNSPGRRPDSALNNLKTVRQENSFASSSTMSIPEKAFKVVGSAFTGALTGMALTGGPWGIGIGMAAGIANALMPGADARPVDPVPARDAGENSVANIAAQDGKESAGMAALPQSTSTVPTNTTGAPAPISPEGVIKRGIATFQANCMADTELCRSVGSHFQQQNALDLVQRDIQQIERNPNNPDYTEIILMATLQSGIAASEVHENLWQRDDFRQHIATQLVKGEYSEYPLPGLNGTPEDVLKRAAAAESAIKANNYYSFPTDTTAVSTVEQRKYGLFASYIEDYQLLFRLRESEPAVQKLAANIQENDETLKNLTANQLWQNRDFARQMMGEITSGKIKLNGAELTGSYNTLKPLLTGIKHPVRQAKPFPPGVPLPIAELNNLREVYTRIFPLDSSPEAFGEYLAREFPGEVGDPTSKYIEVASTAGQQSGEKVSLVDRLKNSADKQLYKYPSESESRGGTRYLAYSEELIHGIKAYNIANAYRSKTEVEPSPAQSEKEIHIHQQAMQSVQAIYNHSPQVINRRETLQWAQEFTPSPELIDVFSNVGEGWIDIFAQFYDNKMGGEKLSHEEVNDLLVEYNFPMPSFVRETGGKIVHEVCQGLNSRLMMTDLLHLHPKEMADILQADYPDFNASTLEPLLNAKPDSISWPTEIAANPELQQKITQYISASVKQRIDAQDHYQQLVMVAVESTISATPVLKQIVSETLQRLGIDADPDTKITLDIDATSWLPDTMENDVLYGSSRQQIDTTIGGLILGTFRQPFKANLGFRRNIIDGFAHHKPTILAVRLSTDTTQPVSNSCKTTEPSTTPTPGNGTDLAQQLFDNRAALTADVDINKYALSKLSFIMNPESRAFLVNDKVRMTTEGIDRLIDDIKERKVVIKRDVTQALKKLTALRNGQAVEHGTFYAKSRGGNYPAGNMVWVNLNPYQNVIISQSTGQTMIASQQDLDNLRSGEINNVSSELFSFITSHLDAKQLFDATLKTPTQLEEAFNKYRYSLSYEKPDRMLQGLHDLRRMAREIRTKFKDRVDCDETLKKALEEMERDPKALERVLPFWMNMNAEEGSEIKLELGQNVAKSRTLEQTSKNNVMWDAVSSARALDHHTNTAAELSEEQWRETLSTAISIGLSIATAGAASGAAALAQLGSKAVWFLHMAMQAGMAGAEQTLRALAQTNEMQRQAEFTGIPLAILTSIVTDVAADKIAPAVLKQLKHAWSTTKNINVLKGILANYSKQMKPELVALERQWVNLTPSHKTSLVVDALMETEAARNKMAGGSSRSSLVGQISENIGEHRQLRGAMQESSFFDEYMVGYRALDENPPLVPFDSHSQAPTSTAYRTPEARTGNGERYRLNEDTVMQDYPVPPNGVYEQYYKQAENNVAAYQRLYGADTAQLHRYYDNWEQRISAQLPDLPGESLARLLSDESVGLETIVSLEDLRPTRQTEAITALVDELDSKGIYHPDITLDNLHYDFAQKKLMLENFDQAELLPEGSALSVDQRNKMQQQISSALSSAMEIKQRVIDDLLSATREMNLDNSPPLSLLSTHGNIQQIREVYDKIKRGGTDGEIYNELIDSYRKRYGDNVSSQQELTIHYEKGSNGEIVLSLRKDGDGPPQPDATAPAIAETLPSDIRDNLRTKIANSLSKHQESFESNKQLLTNLNDADFETFSRLQKNSRSIIQSSPSESPQKFVTGLMKKAGIITEAERKEYKKLVKQTLDKDITYEKLVPDSVEIQTREQLINTPPGEVVVFTNNFNMVEGIMVSHGNGRFSGANLDKLEGTLGSGVQMVVAENFDDLIDGRVHTQLGDLTLRRGGIGNAPTNRNPQFVTNQRPDRIVQLSGDGAAIRISRVHAAVEGQPDPDPLPIKITYSMHGAPGSSFDKQLVQENANIIRAMIKMKGYNVEGLTEMNFISCYSAVGGSAASNGQSMANELGVPVTGYKGPTSRHKASQGEDKVIFAPMGNSAKKAVVKTVNHLLHGTTETIREFRHKVSKEAARSSRTKREAGTSFDTNNGAISADAKAKIERIVRELPSWLSDEATVGETLIRILANRELAEQLGLGAAPALDTHEMEMAQNMMAGATRVELRQGMMKSACGGTAGCEGLMDTMAVAIHHHQGTQMMDNISRVVSKTDHAKSALFNKRMKVLNTHTPYAPGMKEQLFIGGSAHARAAWKQNEVMDSLRSSVGATAYQLKTEQHSVLIGKSADQNDNTFWYLFDPRVGMAEYETPEALDTALGQTIFTETVAQSYGAKWVDAAGTIQSLQEGEAFAPLDTEPAYELLKLNTARIAEYQLPGTNGCKVKDLSQPHLPDTLSTVKGVDGKLRLVDENATSATAAIQHVPNYHGSKKMQMASLDRPDIQTSWKKVAEGLQSKKVVEVISIDDQMSKNWHPQGNQAQALQSILQDHGVGYIAQPQNFMPQDYRFPEDVDVTQLAAGSDEQVRLEQLDSLAEKINDFRIKHAGTENLIAIQGAKGDERVGMVKAAAEMKKRWDANKDVNRQDVLDGRKSVEVNTRLSDDFRQEQYADNACYPLVKNAINNVRGTGHPAAVATPAEVRELNALLELWVTRSS
ncbi:hypothetical protein SC171_28840 [Pantoea cypripedii]|uniref:hypothetical protein n=1 Tax=Pantoea cypripedii TaxID=55209 RepID=UPI002FC89DEA